MKNVILKKGAQRFVLSHHPWVYQQAIDKANSYIPPGEIVRIVNSDNRFLAYGFYNKASALSLRILELDESSIPDEKWIYKKIEEAIGRRDKILNNETDSCRLVYSESDYLPGLIVDKYGDYLVLQIHTTGMERFKNSIIDFLNKLVQPQRIIEKHDPRIRELEHLENIIPDENIPIESLTIIESGIRYKMVIGSGQKTGFYCDQRDNRVSVASYAEGKKVLDCFSYTGSFALHCLKNKAQHVLRIDSNHDALSLGNENIVQNGFSLEHSPSLCGDVFELLREFRDGNKTFDMIILDPPKLASTKREKDRAFRAYKDINLFAMKLLNPNGILASFSCSRCITRDDLRILLSWAAKDARRQPHIITTLSQPEDHPINVFFPESEYLKGFICRVL